MSVQIEESRKKELEDEFQQAYFEQIKSTLKREIENWMTIFPEGKNIFNAFNTTPFDDVKVVVLGQDPYHWYWEAHGLSFSVQKWVRVPPSLRNIYKELNDDLGVTIPNSGDLTWWARQWVFLLNASLTVRRDQANSHKDIWWQIFTNAVIKLLSDKKENLVFILRGSFAQQKEMLIDKSRHLVIKSPHPSPFSADRWFFGSKPFSKANNFLERTGQEVINWEL